MSSISLKRLYISHKHRLYSKREKINWKIIFHFILILEDHVAIWVCSLPARVTLLEYKSDHVISQLKNFWWLPITCRKMTWSPYYLEPSWSSTTNLCNLRPYSLSQTYSTSATKSLLLSFKIPNLFLSQDFWTCCFLNQNSPPARFTQPVLSLHAGVFREAFP